MVNLFKSKKDKEKESDANPEDLFKLQSGDSFDKKKINKVLNEDNNDEDNIPKKVDDFEVSESEEFELGERIEKKEKVKKEKVKKVNIDRYKDLEGITIKKLVTGLWLVEHRLLIITIFYGFLALIGIVTWGIFIYTFGGYLILGMRFDDRNIAAIVNGAEVPHEVILQQSPKGLRFGNVKTIKLDDGRYDFLIEVTNINAQHWAKFEYYFRSSGRSIGHAEGFILPNETKYLYLLAEKLDREPAGVEFQIDNLQWERISQAEYPDWQKFYDDRTRIEISDEEFISETLSELSEKVDLNLLKFKIYNNTAYNYWVIDIGIRLMSRNTIIGAEKIVVSNLMSGEIRDVEITWPGKLSTVGEIVIVPEVNIVDDNVYIKPTGEIGEVK